MTEVQTLPADLANLDVYCPADRIEPPAEWMIGLVLEAERRAGPKCRAVATQLLRGLPKSMATAAAGVSNNQIERWAEADRTLGDVLQQLESAGIARCLESELYRRATAGPSDRGSMRALELALKSRKAEYRDKQQMTLTVVASARQADASLLAEYIEDPS